MIVDGGGYGDWKYNKGSLKERMDGIKKALKVARADFGLEFDTIALHGTSGTWLGGMLVMAGYNVIMIRKEGERTHGRSIEGNEDKRVKNIIVIDDFICSGDTLRNVNLLIKKHCERTGDPHPTVVGYIMHSRNNSTTFNNLPVINSYGMGNEW